MMTTHEFSVSKSDSKHSLMIVHDDQDFNFPLETIAPFVQSFANKTGVPVGGTHAMRSERLRHELPRHSAVSILGQDMILWKRCNKLGVESSFATFVKKHSNLDPVRKDVTMVLLL